jgi:conjugative transfer signal peptidase TraF
LRASAWSLLGRREHAVAALAGVLGLFALVAATAPADRHAVLVNTTPSEPIGLYLRTRLAPTRGRLIAFPAPATAFPYADRRLSYLHRTLMLKTMAAGSGDQVCTTDGIARVNGKVWGVVATLDHEGRPLPRWRACRRLGSGELFALANRVPNSFDSRYFGPVPAASVIGVYRPLLVLKDRP